VALAAPAGPFAASGPLRAALAALASVAGGPARIEGAPPGALAIEAGGRRIVLDAADAAPRLEGCP
jgi:hypothetical protein